MEKDLPLQLLEEIKAFLFPYLIIGPLLAALFAERIDNLLVACLLFLGVVVSAFWWVRNRLLALEELVKAQDARLQELESALSAGGAQEKSAESLERTEAREYSEKFGR